MGIKALNPFSKDSEYKFGMTDEEWKELKDKNVVEYELAKQYAKDNIDLDAISDSEPPRLYRRVDCLSQATLSDSLRLS